MKNSKKLSPSEIEKIKSFISKYSNLNDKVLSVEKRLNSLEEEKIKIMNESKSLHEEINKVRKQEDSFRNKLLTKYGEFELNLETFEIKQS
jgi:hypothetical protein